MTEYLSMSLEDAMASPVPMYYISFPCAKDPTWEQRHPGESVSTGCRGDGLQGSHFSGIVLISGNMEVPFQGKSHSFSEKGM